MGLGFDFGFFGSQPQGAAWHPDDYFPTWDAYFIAEAADVGSPGDGNAVAAWANRGTADLSWRQGTAGNRPLWRAADAGLNNRPALDFDGSDDRMISRNAANSADAPVSVVAEADSVTIIIVLLPDASGTDASSARDNDGVFTTTATAWIAVGLRGSGATKEVQAYNADVDTDQNAHTIVYGEPLVLVCRHSGGNWLTSVQGGADASVASGDTGNITVNMMLGESIGTAANLNGRIAFFAAVKDGNPANLASAINNLKAYYGIA